jgi:hypothetical protein
MGVPLAVLLGTLIAPVNAAAQAPTTPHIDPEDPCASTGLPAISESGRRIAVLRCTSDLADARVATLVVLAANDGRELQSLVLSRCTAGCDDMTAPAIVRRRAERGSALLRAGRFVPLLPVPGFADGGSEGTTATRTVRFDRARSVLSVLDTAGSSLIERRIAGWSGDPYCCGLASDDTTRCVRAAEVWAVFIDAVGEHLLVLVGTDSGAPDGCEVGPNYLTFSL